MNLCQNLLLVIGIGVLTGGALYESFVIIAVGGLVATASVAARTVEQLIGIFEERRATGRFFKELQRETRRAHNRA